MKLFSPKKHKSTQKPSATKARAADRGASAPLAPKKAELSLFFQKPADLPPDVVARLGKECQQGRERFESFNLSRLKLAFGSFDEPMKKALFEILYLLHVNDPKLEEWRFKVKTRSEQGEREVERCMNLYLEGCPSGVAGMDQLPEVFLDEFSEHIREVFDASSPLPTTDNPAVVGVFSIGSIGTIGHKHLSSDLDLEVLYHTSPFFIPLKERDDNYYKTVLLLKTKQKIAEIKKKSKIGAKGFTPELNKKLAQKVQQALHTKFPLLERHLLLKNLNLADYYLKKPSKDLRQKVIAEVGGLLKNYQTSADQETLLKKRINLIQDYVNQKYPSAEIYLFPLSEHQMAEGAFSSTLESKESSGSAYEKILNYDTLMPGIYFNNSIPTHFLFSQALNNGKNMERLIDFLRFGILDEVYQGGGHNLNHQGPTPDLSYEYVADHHTAIYWEAFKASYGNLPKALLNLLRYEMLLVPKLNKTVIQLIKYPDCIDSWACEAESREKEGFIFSSAAVLELEKNFDPLQFDPWWLRYKALKIGYSSDGLIPGIELEEMEEITTLIDLCFALHVKLSDVFHYRKGNGPHREEVLAEFLAQAFPLGSKNRKVLDAVFIGETSEVARLEQRLKKVFKTSVERVLKKTGHYEKDQSLEENPEVAIWFHFYQKNFEYGPEVVPKGILSHLQVPRGQVLIGFEPGKGWFFKSIQKHKTQRYTDLANLPEEIILVDHCRFLWGLAYCNQNGYYGILDRGTLKERYTSLALMGSKLNLNDKVDDQYAFINPSQVEQIMLTIERFFPRTKPNYLTVIHEKQKITHVYVFLNLLRFGLVEFLFRDNLGVLRLKSIPCPNMKKRYQTYEHAFLDALQDKELEQRITALFLALHTHPQLIPCVAWVNSNSFVTSHSVTNIKKKEKDLNQALAQRIMHLPGLPPLVVGDVVAHQTLVAIWVVNNPVVLPGQPQQAHIVVFTGGRLGLQTITLLGKIRL